MYSAVSARRVPNELKKLSTSDYRRVKDAILRLAAEPRPPGYVKLAGPSGHYRIRAAQFRVIYEVRDAELIVLVVRVTRRNEGTYRGL